MRQQRVPLTIRYNNNQKESTLRPANSSLASAHSSKQLGQDRVVPETVQTRSESTPGRSNEQSKQIGLFLLLPLNPFFQELPALDNLHK